MGRLRGGWVAEFPHDAAVGLFALAADIESYPRFLPWCRLTRIRRRDGERMEVDNLFGAGPVQARFRSLAILTPPERLEITSSDGPFRHFRLTWTFTPLPHGEGCRVTVDYTITFRSGLLGRLAELGRAEMERRIAQAFRERARRVFAR